ncbi:MAG: hypothetical protein IPG45_35475 [Deltaproteobacteria bacterium]|nr:hypothetical protein [Deltaproteobacteria bacterium]
MRLQPLGLYVRPGLDELATEALALRLSLHELAAICENHPHAVAPLYPMLRNGSSGLSAALVAGERALAPSTEPGELGRRIGQALKTWGRSAGRSLAAPVALSELAADLPELTALALVIRPFVLQFGAHLTRTPLAPLTGIRATPIAAPSHPIDLGAAVASICTNSAKLRHYARLIAEGPRGAWFGQAPGQPPSEAQQWHQVAEFLFELHTFGPDHLITRHGDLGRLAIEELSRAQATPAPEPPNWEDLASLVTALYSAHGDAARPLIDTLVRSDGLIPSRIPELEQVLAATPEQTYAGVGIAGIQHLLPSCVPLIEAFLRKGAQPSEIWLLAKDYTNNPLVIAYLRILGVHVMDATEDVDGTFHVEEARARDVASFARAAGSALDQCRLQLVLDDGAALISHLNQAGEGRRRAVELTTRGHQRLLALDLQFPAISIARAPNKIDEGEVIGVDLAHGLLRELRWQSGPVEPKPVLAVGLGTVGSSFLQELGQHGLQAIGFDNDEQKRIAAALKAPDASVVDNLEQGLRAASYAVLITGQGPADAKNFVAHGVQVASGSSEAVELDENQFYELGFFNAPLNGMRPLNFVRNGHETLSFRQIGLTRATFFEACTQVLNATEPGRSELQTTPALEAAAALWKQEGRTTPRPRPKGPPLPPRSFSGVRPTHGEWMRFFLAGAESEEAPMMVRPAPSAVNFAPQPYLYFFEGEWHQVDTRSGESHPVQVGAEWNDAKTQLLVLNDSDQSRSALLRPSQDGSQLVLLNPNGRAEPPMILGRPAAVSTRFVPETPEVRFNWIFEGPTQVQVLSGGPKPKVRRFDRVDHAPSRYAVLPDETLLQVTNGPRVYLHPPAGEVARIENHGLARVTGLSTPANRPEDSSGVFLVGEEPTGRTAVLRFEGAEALGRVVLPEGARYRRVDAFGGRPPVVVFELHGKLEHLELPLS